MRKLTKREIQIRWGMLAGDQVKSAFIVEFRGEEFTVRNYGLGQFPWTLHISSMPDAGFKGMTDGFKTLHSAVSFGESIINVNLLKEVSYG